MPKDQAIPVMLCYHIVFPVLSSYPQHDIYMSFSSISCDILLTVPHPNSVRTGWGYHCGVLEDFGMCCVMKTHYLLCREFFCLLNLNWAIFWNSNLAVSLLLIINLRNPFIWDSHALSAFRLHSSDLSVYFSIFCIWQLSEGLSART
jgi:hypothetical protein